MNGGSHVSQPYLILWGSGIPLSCGQDGQVFAEELHGLFAGDTRVLSTYQVRVNGHSWHLLGRSHHGHGSAQWKYQNRPLRDVAGEVSAGALLLTLRRRVDCALHDDLHLQAFAQRAVRLQFTLQLDADFADIFEVKSQSLPPRLAIRRVAQGNRVALSYEKEGFRRGIEIHLDPSSGQPVFVGTRIVFELQLDPGAEWTCEPGKLPHEARRGELAMRNAIPFSPAYYGTHDAPALYCLTLWHAWRWTGDDQLLAAHLEAAKAAMRWCDEHGDRDGDGLLEYETRSPKGYRNQSWKDAEDAVVHADGRQADLPLATVELQGYLFAAQVAMAELLAAQGEQAEAERLRQAAHKLRNIVEERYWIEEEGFYAFALDGQKRQVASISSNPGHLLWWGLPAPKRAAALAERLLKPDLFSGWGLRTLSSENPAYNPLSYQRGSVWPHDTLLAAAGLWRYGYYEEASTLIRAILEAARAFEDARLPELFCGLPRAHDLPVPYAQANIPQAWAAAAPILAAQLFLGLLPDAPHGRCFVSPRLPEWLPRLELQGIAIGQGSLDITVTRRGTETVIEQMERKEIEVIEGTVEAPLWGMPPLEHEKEHGSKLG